MGGAPGVTVPDAPRGAAGIADRTLTAARHGPQGVALRLGAMAVAAIVVAWFHRLSDPGVLCPLRAFTGIPCPACGGTTVFIELGSGRFAHAALANPVVLAGALGLALAPLGWGRRWWALENRTRVCALGAALLGSELWQLARFDLLQF